MAHAGDELGREIALCPLKRTLGAIEVEESVGPLAGWSDAQQDARVVGKREPDIFGLVVGEGARVDAQDLETRTKISLWSGRKGGQRRAED